MSGYLHKGYKIQVLKICEKVTQIHKILSMFRKLRLGWFPKDFPRRSHVNEL